jgi:hypothetical protein
VFTGIKQWHKHIRRLQFTTIQILALSNMNLELLIRANIALAVDYPSPTSSILALVVLHTKISIRKLHRDNCLGPVILVLETKLLPRVASVPIHSVREDPYVSYKT